MIFIWEFIETGEVFKFGTTNVRIVAYEVLILLFVVNAVLLRNLWGKMDIKKVSSYLSQLKFYFHKLNSQFSRSSIFANLCQALRGFLSLARFFTRYHWQAVVL